MAVFKDIEGVHKITSRHSMPLAYHALAVIVAPVAYPEKDNMWRAGSRKGVARQWMTAGGPQAAAAAGAPLASARSRMPMSIRRSMTKNIGSVRARQMIVLAMPGS